MKENKATNPVIIDPVCGMKKQVSQMKFTENYQRMIVHFCSQQCKDAFYKFPDRYSQVVINFQKEHSN